MTRSASHWLLMVLTLACAGSAQALPIVSVDTQPGVTGIQPSSTTGFGSLVIDVRISGVEAGAPLNAFEFDLAFDSIVLTAVSVADGGFLLDPVIIVQQDVGSVTVEFAEATLGPGGAVGDGVLASITFNGIGLGISALDLDNVLLSAPFGVPIGTDAVVDGSVTVVPEPSTALLLAGGLALLGLRRTRPESL